jgi:hypothetical protein
MLLQQTGHATHYQPTYLIGPVLGYDHVSAGPQAIIDPRLIVYGLDNPTPLLYGFDAPTGARVLRGGV